VPTDAELESRPAALRLGLRVEHRLAPAGIFVVALPILFLHAAFQPTLHVHLGTTAVDLRLADLAVVAIAAVALAVASRVGFGDLRRGRLVWLAAGSFLVYIVVATFYPLALHDGYPWRTHLVTAVKYAEYAVLAPAVVLLVRRRTDLLLVAWTIVGVSVAASLVGVLQFAGVDIFRAWPSGGRQPSFVGVDDFGMLSAASFAVALAAVAAGPRTRNEIRLVCAAAAAGAVGMILSGALASVLGALLAALVAVAVAWRVRAIDVKRAAVVASFVVIVLAGSVFMRSSALSSFAHFAGLGQSTGGRKVESYSHRWVLDYVGLQIFLRHPVLGAGWQAGYDEPTYGPVLPKARRRFPSQPPLAFPSPAHPWGIQSAYVEALAELGLVGAAVFALWIVSGLFVGARPFARRAHEPPAWPRYLGLLWICVALGVWNGLWFIAGIPFDTLIWLAFGFAAAPLTCATDPGE
jgi:hypothetical protein